MSGAARRLRLVSGEPARGPAVRFCGHCGEAPVHERLGARVCEHCGMGIILRAQAADVPGPGDAFLVIDARLTVCAVSRAAEQLLGVEETAAVHRHVAEFLGPADAESPGPEQLVAGVISAAGEGVAQSIVVRPVGEFGLRYRARIAACGPPSAALVVLTGV